MTLKKEKNKMNTFNTITYDCNSKKFVPYDVLPYLRRCYEKKDDKPKTVEEFTQFVKDESMYQFWSRCEYEVILVDWPNQSISKKTDVYDQIMANIDVVVKLLMEDLA